MRTADLLSHFPGRGPGALAALLLGALALHAARLPAQPARPADPAPAGNDVLATVQETGTGTSVFGVGVNTAAGLTGRFLNERNFDLVRPPAGLEDLLGGAFRGAGQELRIEAIPGTQLQRYGASFRDR
jgi:outer membrane protein insertion porin family